MWNKFQFSDSDHPARPRVARFERKTKREAAGTTTIPIDARQNANHASGFSRFSWSADSREQDKTRWKRERERERWSASGGRDITEQALHTHCGHPASLLFHAAKYRVLFTRRFQPRVENSPLVHVGCHVLFILRERTWIRTDDYKSDINLFSSLSFLLSKFSFFLCFFQVESGGGRVLKVRFRFWAAARKVKVKARDKCNGINFFFFLRVCVFVYRSHGVMKK